MFRIAKAFLTATLVAFGAVGAALPAVPATSAVHVHVVDSQGKTVWMAAVRIVGPAELGAITDKNGDGNFTSVVAGRYQLRVYRYGYDVPVLTIVVPTVGTVNVQLRRTYLRTIAQTRTATKTPDARVDGNDAAAQLNDSLVAGLESLPGTELGPAGGISFRGYSPTQTAITMNGVPVSRAGSVFNIVGAEADLFSDASVAPGAGGGAQVNFQTRSPTLNWLGTLRYLAGSYNGSDFVAAEGGTTGDLGVSISHAQRIIPNALDGLTYRDASGLLYSHEASPVVEGDALQLRFQTSQSNTLIGSAVSVNSVVPLVCNDYTGRVPCGYGPGNVLTDHITSLQLRDTASFGMYGLTATLYSNSDRSGADESGFYVAGILMPNESRATTTTQGIMVDTAARLGTRDVTLSLRASDSATASDGDAFGTFLSPVLASFRSRAFDASLPLVVTAHGTLSANAGWQSQSADGITIAQTDAGLHASYAARSDSFGGSFTVGSLGSPVAPFNGVSSPQSLNFICGAGVGTGGGPTIASTRATVQTSTDLQWSHTARSWALALDLYDNVQTHAPISGIVGANALPPSLFSATYLDQAQQLDADVCGGSKPVGLGDLYFSVSGVAQRAVYQGASVQLTKKIGTSGRLTASYGTTSARAYGDPSLLFNAYSTVRAGFQLPNVPPYQGSLSYVDAISHNVSALLAARYASSNNANNLPDYVTLDAGLAIPLANGIGAISVTNITNRFPGPYARPSGAIPLPLVAGALPTVAQPLSPRTVAVGYRFHIGPHEENTTFEVPVTQFQVPSVGIAQNPGTPFEVPLRSDPLSLDRNSVLCGPRDVPQAQTLLLALRAYVEGIEHARNGISYPDAYPLKVVGAVAFQFIPSGNSYVVTFVQAPGASVEDFVRALVPMENCARVHYSDDDGVYREFNLPDPDQFAVPIVRRLLPIYSPQVGLYQWSLSLTPSDLSERPSFPPNLAYQGVAPQQPIGQPFAVKDWRGCPAEVRPSAQEFLDELRDYVHALYDLHQNPRNPDGMLIERHMGAGGSWLSIRTEDLDQMHALVEACAFVKDEGSSQLQRLGLDGDATPVLNYSSSLGLYNTIP